VSATFRSGTRRLATAIVLTFLLAGGSRAQAAGEHPAVSFRTTFLQSCDVACQYVDATAGSADAPKPNAVYRDLYTSYKDSYAVRGLAVAYDLTGARKYLDACRKWSDRTVGLQSRMTPAGAYYMNYGRKPGETKGEWYVADSACIALAVLATAVRVRDAAEKRRYLDSVHKFAKLVIDNYVGSNGGIRDGAWSQFDGEYWCSSGTFASLALCLYAETGHEPYRKVGLRVVDWLNSQELRRLQPGTFEKDAPMMIMYYFEGYSTALPYLKPGSPRRAAAMKKYHEALEWMARNQKGRGAGAAWEYESWQGAKFGGLPFHMYVYARNVPGSGAVALAADQELGYISRLLAQQAPPVLSALRSFAMLSCAEKLRPGALYRGEKL
jgi:hypothetical protein